MTDYTMNARRFNFQFAALPIEILQDHDRGELRDVDLVIVSKLIGKFRTWLIHEHDDALAHLCGVGLSTFKACMKRLRKLGRIRSVKATVRGFRRALSMVWLAPSEEARQPLLQTAPEATAVAPEGPSLRPETEAPPDPPIEEPERRTDDDDSSGVDPDASPVESSSSSSDEPDEPRKATKAEVDAVVAKAKKLFPQAWLVGQQVKDQAKKCVPHGGGLSWVAMALNEAEAARAHSFGHVVKTLGIWREQGYPSPRQSAPISSRSIAQTLVDKQREEHLASIAEARKPAPPPSEEEIATWLAWVAAGPRQPLYRFAVGRLEQAGIPIPVTS